MNSMCSIWKTGIFGKLALSAFCVIASACGVADEGSPDAAAFVREGRLTFRDMQAFADTVQELNGVTPTSVGPDYLENRFRGFHALGASDPEGASLPPLLQTILAQDHTYQIADQIHLILAGMEYSIPESQAQLVTTLGAGASAAPYIAAGTIQAFQPRHITPDTLPPASSSLLDAKYQFSFPGPSPFTFKLVDESYVDLFATFTSTCFRAKMEYNKGSGWNAAGEMVDKRITSAQVNYNFSTTTGAQAVSVLLPSVEQNDGNNLVLCYSIPVGPHGTCIQNVQLFANYDSVVVAGSPLIIGMRYAIPAAWTSEYQGLRNCP